MRGPADHEWDRKGFGPYGILGIGGAVAAHGLAMVGGEDNYGVLFQPGFLEGVQDTAEITVHRSDVGQVVADRRSLGHGGVGVLPDVEL